MHGTRQREKSKFLKRSINKSSSALPQQPKELPKKELSHKEMLEYSYDQIYLDAIRYRKENF